MLGLRPLLKRDRFRGVCRLRPLSFRLVDKAPVPEPADPTLPPRLPPGTLGGGGGITGVMLNECSAMFAPGLTAVRFTADLVVEAGGCTAAAVFSAVSVLCDAATASACATLAAAAGRS